MYKPCSDIVSIADGVKHSYLGSGSVKLYLPDNTFLTVINVRHVPTFDYNLLSLRVIEAKGVEIVLKDARCIMYMNREILY
jgi:hypothetical protein